MNTRDAKMVEYMLNNSEHDNQKAFLAGWDEALKNQWVNVKDRTPQKNEKVFVLYEYNGSIMIDTDVYFGEFFYKIQGRIWNFGGSKILAWMPIPSFDEI